MDNKTVEERTKYAREFIKKINRYNRELQTRLGKDLPYTILDYMDTSTILNYLTDRYDYWIDYCENLSDEELSESREFISNMEEEYQFFEQFVFGLTNSIKDEYKNNNIERITKEEIEHVSKNKGKGTTIPTDEQMYKMCEWLRISYYTFKKHYMDKEITISLPGNKKYTFRIDEAKIAHLLGIDSKDIDFSEIFSKETLTKYQVENSSFNYQLFAYMTDRDNMAQIIAMQKSKGRPLFDYTKIKARNYLFQNFGSLLNILSIVYDVPSTKNGEDPSDTYLIQNLKNCFGNDKSFLGFYKEHAITLQAHKGMYYYSQTSANKTCGKMSFSTAVFTKDLSRKGSKIQGIDEHQTKNLSSYEPLCIFSVNEELELIKRILEDDPQGRNPLNSSLLAYHQLLIAGQKNYIQVKERLDTLKERLASMGGRKR